MSRTPLFPPLFKRSTGSRDISLDAVAAGVPTPALAFTERFKAWLGSLHDLAISHPIRKAKTKELKIKIWRSNWDMTL
jgi:hypothetical protein